MSYNLYGKEVDITIDHVGKLNAEKPIIAKFRLFCKGKSEIENIFYFFKEIMQYKKSINKLINTEIK
jgi:hypothetical protein